MKITNELTLEQEFQLKMYFEKTKLMNSQECRMLLLEAVKQNMIKDNFIKSLILNPILPLNKG